MNDTAPYLSPGDVVITPREFAFWPSPDDPAPLGVVMGENQNGFPVTCFVEPGWLRLLLSAPAPWDLAPFELNPAALPFMFPGWPDSWAESDLGLRRIATVEGWHRDALEHGFEALRELCLEVSGGLFIAFDDPEEVAAS